MNMVLVCLVVGRCLVDLWLRLDDYKNFSFADRVSLRTRSKKSKVFCSLYKCLPAAINPHRVSSSSFASRAIGCYFGSIMFTVLICSKVNLRFKTSIFIRPRVLLFDRKFFPVKTNTSGLLPLCLLYCLVFYKLLLINRDDLWFVNLGGFLLGVRMSSPVRLMTFAILFAAERSMFRRMTIFSDQPYRCYIRNQSGKFTTSLFHRGNGIPHVKCIHRVPSSSDLSINPSTSLFHRGNGIPHVKCIHLLLSSSDSGVNSAIRLSAFQRWVWPYNMLGLYDPIRAILYGSFLLYLINSIDDITSCLARNISLVCIRLTRVFTQSSLLILERVVVASGCVLGGTKRFRIDLFASLHVLCLEVVAVLVPTSVGDRNSFTKSLWKVITFRASDYVVKPRLTHSKLALDPLSLILCDEHSIFTYAFKFHVFCFQIRGCLFPHCIATRV